MQSPPQQSRRVRGPQSVADCSSLGDLFTKAAALEKLDQQLRQRLLPTLAEQVRLGGVHGERIIFVASSAAWASRLRMEQAAILRLARTLGVSARILIVKVAPLPTPPPEQPTARLVLSPAAARHLRAAANSLADLDLRARFLALASLAEA
jgi:hypothetical protein